MDKFVCKDCGRIFDMYSADIEEEENYAPYGESYAIERLTYMYCPDCGSDNYKNYYGDLDDGDNIDDENDDYDEEEESDDGCDVFGELYGNQD